MAAVPPLATTTALRATSCSPPTSIVRGSTSLPSPRNSFAPFFSSAAAGRESSKSRAIQSTRLETFGKSTSHSTRDAERARARPASSSTSPERSRVFDGTQPQYGHSPPTSSRSTTATDRPLPSSLPTSASPATPPPRHRTSNSCGNLLTSIAALAAQGFEERRRRERAHVTVPLVDGCTLGRARERCRECFGQSA